MMAAPEYVVKIQESDTYKLGKLLMERSNVPLAAVSGPATQ